MAKLPIPPQAKIIVIGVGVLAVAVIGITLLKRFGNIGRGRKGKEEVREVEKELKSMRQKPSFSPSQYKTWANQLQTAFAGCGTSNAVVMGVMGKINNKADLLSLIDAYGVRKHDGCNSANASVNSQNTKLMHFAGKGSAKKVDSLINDGADVNTCNNKNESLLTIATMQIKPEVVKTLLGHNADITLTDCNGDTALTHNQNQTFEIFKSQKQRKSHKASQEIGDQLCTRSAHDHMEKLNNHTSRYHCGKGEEVLASGVARRWANNGDSKTLFPERWIEIETAKAIKSVLHSPEKLYRRGSTKLVVEGKLKEVPTLVAEGNFKDVSKEEGNFNVSIRVIIAKNGPESNVVTAYPLINKEEEKAYSYALEAGKGE